MQCPRHPGNTLAKARLSVYWCGECGAWLIQPLREYKTFGEESKTWEQDWKEKQNVAIPPKVQRVQNVQSRVSEEKGDYKE